MRYNQFYPPFCRGVQCHDTVNGAQCDSCPVGYEGDGRTCTLRNPCLDTPCPSGKSTKKWALPLCILLCGLFDLSISYGTSSGSVVFGGHVLFSALFMANLSLSCCDLQLILWVGLNFG